MGPMFVLRISSFLRHSSLGIAPSVFSVFSVVKQNVPTQFPPPPNCQPMSEDSIQPDTPEAQEQTPEDQTPEEQSPEELAEAKEYGRRDLYCTLADRALDLTLLVALTALFATADAPLVQWITNLSSVATFQLLILFAIVTGISLIVGFPLAYYSGFVLEHQFSLSNQTRGRWLWRYIKSHTLELVFGAALIAGLYWIIWTTHGWWWLVAAGAFFLVSIALGQLAPVLFLPLFYKITKIEGDQSVDLNERMARLSEGTGLSIKGVYRMDLSAETVKANAMLAGMGRTRRVLMGDTLLDNFTPEEIEVIFAHEIGHHVHRHIRKLILMGLGYSVAGFWIADLALRQGFDAATAASSADFYANFPFYALPAAMLVLTLFAMITEPLQNAVSRHFERQSDQYALDRSGHREAYISAFKKLARQNKDDPDPHPLEVFFFSSHPPIAERLAIAQQKHD